MTRTAHIRRVAACVVLCACALAQCAAGAELPKRKPGQWQLTITSDNPNIPPRIEDVCLDDATEALLDKFALGASQQTCSKFDWKNLGGGKASVEATCALGSTQMSIRGDIVFTGNTAYREEIKTHFDPPLHGRGDTTSTTDGKWTGACAADMKPGDVVTQPSAAMPVSMRINLNQMMKSEGR